MKDFDAERITRDLKFRIGGKDFEFRPGVQQELVDRYWDTMSSAESTNEEILTSMDDLVLGGLRPEFHDAWREARGTEAEKPLMSSDIRNVITYMLECMLARPIESPSGSGSTLEPTGTSLTDELPVLEAVS